MEEFSIDQISLIYSYLGHRCIYAGDIEAVKYLYGHSYHEEPPLIETISALQYRLTAVEIYDDTENVYSDEFLYYWGMICLGETSRLIVRRLDTATACFDKIKNAVPKAEARLAFIRLLLSEEPHKSENNARQLETLRKWTGKRDVFSSIALAKIIFDSYLREEQPDGQKFPAHAVQLLVTPCKMGHPVAIRFFRAMIDSLSVVHMPDSFNGYLYFHENIYVLYDYTCKERYVRARAYFSNKIQP
jgi:hypothetical protein